MLPPTPRQTPGPFYPLSFPQDADNDLVHVAGHQETAQGTTRITGRILDLNGRPVPGVRVEIWQCDANGVYLHTADSDKKKDQQDKNFQGFGRFMTGSSGEYYFRTIKPVKYPGRTPHIHFKIKQNGRDTLTTQCYIKGEPDNERDGVFRGIRYARARESVLVEFAPVKASKIGELAAKFDIVLGLTPEA